MDLDRMMTRLVAVAVGGAALAMSGRALADPCPTTDLSRVIIGSGGSAVTATMRQVAAAMRSLPDPIIVYWHDPGACIGFKTLIEGLLDPASTTTVKYWEANGTQRECDVPQDVDLPVHFSHMGNTADFCADFADGLPDGFIDVPAPVQTVNIITDRNSSQRSISAEALYHIFGRGAARGDVAPWTNPRHIALRTRSSFVHQFIAYSVFGNQDKVFYDHPSLSTQNDQRLGVETQTNGASVTAVIQAGATNAESPLAYVSGSAADAPATRDKIKTLAYQHYGQSCAYWPDSTESALDKINVRKGLYHYWTPGHFFAPVDENGEYLNPLVKEFLGYFTGALDSPPGVSPPILERIIRSGDIPLCAMEVTREGTAGAISSLQPDQPCGCFFEAIATGDASVCDPCVDSDDCTGGKQCRFGYCEAS